MSEDGEFFFLNYCGVRFVERQFGGFFEKIRLADVFLYHCFRYLASPKTGKLEIRAETRKHRRRVLFKNFYGYLAFDFGFGVLVFCYFEFCVECVHTKNNARASRIRVLQIVLVSKNFTCFLFGDTIFP